MTKAKHSASTRATAWLEQHNIPYTTHHYDYADHGGAQHAADALRVDLHRVAKTLVMENENAQPLIVVMHGDQDVSTKELARQAGTKRITPCAPQVAERHSGYQVGGTSPFGTRKSMPVWVEAGLLTFEKIYINGGRRGFLLGIDPRVLTDLLGGKTIQAGLERSTRQQR